MSAPHSMASSGPLSPLAASPSPPTAPPAPGPAPGKRQHSIDASSELSELTDNDDDDAPKAQTTPKAYTHGRARNNSNPTVSTSNSASINARRGIGHRRLSSLNDVGASRSSSDREPASPGKSVGGSSAPTSRRGKKRRSLIPEPMWGWAYKYDEEDEEGGEEEEGEDKPDGNVTTKAAISNKSKTDANADADDDGATEDEMSDVEEPPAKPAPVAGPSKPTSAARAAEESSDSGESEADEEESATEDPEVGYEDEETASDAEPEPDAGAMDVDVEADAAEVPEPGRADVIAAAQALIGMEDALPTPPVPPTPKAAVTADATANPKPPAAGSSIMAGAEVLDPEADEADEEAEDEEDDVEKTPAPALPKAEEMDVDLAHEDGGGVEEDEAEGEGELQPQHRVEALDELAKIEFKFARLRECVFVEKMDALAWEESLIHSGTHPELLHLQHELTARRDGRIELAERRRVFEVNNALKKRKAADDAVWTWWMNARDDVQNEMIAEANRKRRKIERERRNGERPPPARTLPHPPNEAPPPATLYALVHSHPALMPASEQTRSDRRVYPDLESLPLAETSADLEFIFAHRNAFPPPMALPPPPRDLGPQQPPPDFGRPPQPPPPPEYAVVSGRQQQHPPQAEFVPRDFRPPPPQSQPQPPLPPQQREDRHGTQLPGFGMGSVPTAPPSSVGDHPKVNGWGPATPSHHSHAHNHGPAPHHHHVHHHHHHHHHPPGPGSATASERDRDRDMQREREPEHAALILSPTSARHREREREGWRQEEREREAYARQAALQAREAREQQQREREPPFAREVRDAPFPRGEPAPPNPNSAGPYPRDFGGYAAGAYRVEPIPGRERGDSVHAREPPHSRDGPPHSRDGPPPQHREFAPGPGREFAPPHTPLSREPPFARDVAAAPFGPFPGPRDRERERERDAYVRDREREREPVAYTREREPAPYSNTPRDREREREVNGPFTPRDRDAGTPFPPGPFTREPGGGPGFQRDATGPGFQRDAGPSPFARSPPFTSSPSAFGPPPQSFPPASPYARAEPQATSPYANNATSPYASRGPESFGPGPFGPRTGAGERGRPGVRRQSVSQFSQREDERDVQRERGPPFDRERAFAGPGVPGPLDTRLDGPPRSSMPLDGPRSAMPLDGPRSAMPMDGPPRSAISMDGPGPRSMPLDGPPQRSSMPMDGPARPRGMPLDRVLDGPSTPLPPPPQHRQDEVERMHVDSRPGVAVEGGA